MVLYALDNTHLLVSPVSSIANSLAGKWLSGTAIVVVVWDI